MTGRKTVGVITIQKKKRQALMQKLTDKCINGLIDFFFFFFFLIWVLRPFQEYFTYIKPIVHRRWAKTGEKPPDHP